MTTHKSVKVFMIGFILLLFLIAVFGIMIKQQTSKKENATLDIGNNVNENSNNTVNTTRSLNKVEMTIEKETLTKRGMTIIIADHNAYPYQYEEWFRIDRLDNGEWKELKQIESENLYIFSSVALQVDQKGMLKLEVDWSDLYGELENGTYRLVKRQYENNEYQYFGVEFKI